MPVDERSTKSAERCDLHPGSPSVGRCDSCGRPLCLTCAVPVRGRVLGVECLSLVLGPEAVPEVATRTRQPATSSRALTGVALALAVVATILPWSRFGVGSGAFGAWGRSVRWSLLAGVAATTGLSVWLALRVIRPIPRRWMSLALAALGALVALGAFLAIFRPPPFTRTWIGSWVAMGAGVLACSTALTSRPATLRTSEEP